MTQDELIKKLQKAIGVTPDGKFGPVTEAKSAYFDIDVIATEIPASVKPVPVDGVAPKYWKPLVIDGINVHPIFKVDPPYTHLHPYDFLMHFKGEKEIPGPKDNVLIAHTHEHSANLGPHSDHNDYHDEVANCASGQNWVADGCGCEKAIGALASHFDQYPGPRIKKGQLVKRGMLVRIAHPGGHITQANKDFIWDDNGTFEGFGFNQGNSVKISMYAKNTIVTVHDWKPLPGTVLAPIGTPAVPATGEAGESTR